ncbi:sodium:proton antiporter [Humibacter sp. BT305]|uniref:Sodium:proton antiporter n=1 Tax=Cnuibacter physcomitrellae TaxID=1619308 RepID=A0A1X9LP42_9MICO|nr:sodium:proton antiporter [Cnuibacter physcomitrellae]ARJ06974.1 sodium:proton antiporter [Cnuibacter physcomitrellae]AXH34553.1 sodium:proton antiporter [Humibacter sp. BT305]MCS5497645.1 sodium:proton antiporter [Cnuibacter physcomitrellae]GGI39260.1 peptidase [Cnuibacter physcomitrellae]
MELGVYAVLAVAVIVAVAAFARKLGIAAPIILVVVGVGLSYLPGVPDVEVPHEIILDGLLPPILYAAAVSVPIMDFRRNLAPIASLSVLLVVVTAFATGFLLFELLPDLDFAAAVALGAIISPPDAVAATSIGRRLGLPPRLLTVLEGEGLVNDATALVLLRSAVAASAGLLASPWAGVGDFFYAVIAAVVIGLLAGIVTVFVRSKLDDPVLDTALSLAVPFVAFMPAEALGASGVLAVVVAGLYTGHAAPSRFSPQSRISDRINWRTIQFLLENGVFLLIGLEIRTLVEDVDDSVLSVGASVGIGLIATLALILLRYLWIGPLVFGLRQRERRAERRTYRSLLALYYYRTHPVTTKRQARVRDRLEHDYERRRADLEQQRQEGIDWRGGVVLGWSGMRGVVTLAAAQSLPDTTPYRPQLILIAFTVAVASIVLQGGTLPALIRLLKVQGVDAREDRKELASLLETISGAGLDALDDHVSESGDEVDPDVVERARQTTFLRTEAAWERAGRRELQDQTPHRQFRELRLLIVAAEREKMLELRSLGSYSSRVLAEAQSLLDQEETRLRRRPGGGH